MSQMTKVHFAGAELLLDVLATFAGAEGPAPEQLERLWQDPSFLTWVKAYAPWVEHLEDGLRQLLQNLDNVPSTSPQVFWQQIASGWKGASKLENNARCRQALAAMRQADISRFEKEALAYLPPGTPLSVEIYPTLDGFNGGMFRGRQVFLSVLNIGEDEISAMLRGEVGLGGHELHHIGVMHWFDSNSYLRKLAQEKVGGQLAVKIIEYLVSEGMANAFLSPEIFRLRVGNNPAAEAYNQRLQNLEASWPVGAIEQIEAQLAGALDASTPEELPPIRHAFEVFSMDLSGTGLPEGHFATGKMVQQMAAALPLEKVIGLVYAPWQFFALYNAASAPCAPCFSLALMEQIEKAFPTHPA
jgi:hypothetical protein